MDKKETTIGEKFENFLSFIVTHRTLKKKVKKEPIVFPTTEQCRKQLEEVAKEMELPIEDCRVVVEWCKRGGCYNDKIFVELIAPLYWPSPKFRIEWNEEFQQHVAVKNL